MFRKYVYMTSASKPLVAHFSQLAQEVTQKFGIQEQALAVDIGSNDGTLLKSFRTFGLRTLGIEPATNIARSAQANGIETFNDFFTEGNASLLEHQKGKAQVITATNVFAHVADLEEFLRGIGVLLDEKGLFVVEVPYLVDLLQKVEFDTIYHEHLSYFALRPLVAILKRFDLEAVDVERVNIHGGSIRVFVRKRNSIASISESVEDMLELERKLRLYDLSTYQKFAEEVAHLKTNLLDLLMKLKSAHNRIAGWGASAKGNTLLNYCGIGTHLLDYIVDSTPLKQGLYTPGMHIPVYPEEKIFEDKPNYALILAWNFADAIIERNRRYERVGGRFILPIPKVSIL